MELEICVDSVESAVAAANGGADRIELCSALSEGGITPSVGLINAVREAVAIQIYVIIRPRGGNFVYSGPELEVMRRDIAAAKARGVDGVVLGALTPGDTVDKTLTGELVKLARPLQVTFHRAFDACRNLDEALEDVIACEADRLLTSGGRSDALKGAKAIAGLRHKAAGRISIMAGGGIRIGNVRTIVLRTGIREVHTSLSTAVKSTAYDGGADGNGLQNGFTRFVVKEDDVRHFKSALLRIALESDARSPVQ
ncbi:MAG TPA: copper homeostasis protein CutC [Terracidiphilus sp.]|nr:copper homeostasis protein CutC [Terracidiphilus sp.]